MAWILWVLCLGSGCFYPTFQSMPAGTSHAGEVHAASDVRFFADLTSVDSAGQRHVEQHIFDEVFRMISAAERFVLVDMFLFNDFQGDIREETRALSAELTQTLIARKRERPELGVVVISDPVNTVYGGIESKHFEALEEAGIQVIVTRLDRLRDSNPTYSGFWRLIVKPFRNNNLPTLPSPFGGERVSLRSYLALLNFKANHRKVVLADSGSDYIGLVTSANPHDGSSAHGNVAIRFGGPAVEDLLETEKAIIAFSDGKVPDISIRTSPQVGDSTVQVLTEKKIRDVLLENLERAKRGDRLALAMFYLSDRAVVEELISAHERGSSVRILLDPNKDAFGYKKNGIPNRPVAAALRESGIPVRWCDTHGEQCHAKVLLARYASGEATLILGSANFTRRNLQDFNLETSVALRATREFPAIRDATAWFELLWSNAPGRSFSVDYETYADEALRKRFQYRIEEATGLSTF